MIKSLVEAYARAEDALAAVDFRPALDRHLQALHERGAHLKHVGVNTELPDYVATVRRFYSFFLSSYQEPEEDGLVIEYAHRDEPDEMLGYLTIPWACFSNGEGEETAATQQCSTPTGIHAKLHEYVSSRGIEMPFYTSGSKITEEAGELREALQAHLASPTAETLAHLKEEVADVVIVATVAAHQAGFTVEEGLEAKIAKDTGRGPKREQ